MDAGIYEHLDRALRIAEAEYDRQRSYESSQLVTALRQARASVEVYESWTQADAKRCETCGRAR